MIGLALFANGASVELLLLILLLAGEYLFMSAGLVQTALAMRAGKLLHLHEIFSDRSVDAVFGKIGVFPPGTRRNHCLLDRSSRDLCIDTMLGVTPVCTMSNITLRRGVFERSGGFDPAMVHNEDLEWLIRLFGLGARIIVDDGSADETPRITAGFARDRRVRVIRQANRGLAGARNTDIAAARGDVIRFCHSDDRWRSEKLGTACCASGGKPAGRH